MASPRLGLAADSPLVWGGHDMSQAPEQDAPRSDPQQPPYGGPQGVPQGGWGGQNQPASSDDTLWAVLSHVSFFVVGLIGPLIVMLTKGNESPFVRRHAVEALNFHITVAIASIVSFILVFVLIGFLLLPAVLIAGVVFTIMAAIAASRGEEYRYPISLRLVK